MSKIDDGGPAFARGWSGDSDDLPGSVGMSLLDYFAAQCLSRLIYADIGETHSFADVACVAEDWAKKSYIIAHAMIRERHNQ